MVDGLLLNQNCLYDSLADQWTKVGQLAKARRGHAMSKVPKEIANYCR